GITVRSRSFSTSCMQPGKRSRSHTRVGALTTMLRSYRQRRHGSWNCATERIVSRCSHARQARNAERRVVLPARACFDLKRIKSVFGDLPPKVLIASESDHAVVYFLEIRV